MLQTNILVTGATGLVGSQLVRQLDDVYVTTRNVNRARSILGSAAKDYIEWTNTKQPIDLASIEPLSTVVNLMGEPIDGRWTTAKKQRLRESRVLATRSLIESISRLSQKPQTMVSASAVGYYADCGDSEIDERSPNGSGFLAELCADWEQAAQRAEDLGVRLVILRIGIVLSPNGGALGKMMPIFKSGLAGRIGTGKQYIPWIHIDDLVELIAWAVRNDQANNIYNATAPQPVTNREFTSCLAKTLNRPAFLPVPRLGLRLALGEFADSLFMSQRAIPAAAIRDGFNFQFPTLASALNDLLSNTRQQISHA